LVIDCWNCELHQVRNFPVTKLPNQFCGNFSLAERLQSIIFRVVKHFFFISIALLLFSCATDEQRAGKKDSLRDSVPAFQDATTALQVVPAPLPPGFALDTLSVNDTAKNLYAFFHFPVSNDPKLNAMIIALLKQNLNGYEDYHPGEFDQASVEAWISAFTKNGKFISMCFTDQSFSTGAAHYNHGYTALNYDTLKHQQIFLTDIFTLRTKQEKQAFCDSIQGTDVVSEELVMPDDLSEKTDFIIDQDNIIFYFDDYQKGPSMTTRTVAIRDVKSFLKKEYTSLLK
jgi:hypothetical protein